MQIANVLCLGTCQAKQENLFPALYLLHPHTQSINQSIRRIAHLQILVIISLKKTARKYMQISLLVKNEKALFITN